MLDDEYEGSGQNGAGSHSGTPTNRSDAPIDQPSPSTDRTPTSTIYVPATMYPATQALIASENARVVTVPGDYDAAVAACYAAAQSLAAETYGAQRGIMVQDNAFEGYDVVPEWISEGYGTMLAEIDEQSAELMGEERRLSGRLEDEDSNRQRITHIVTPIGVGSLGHAVVKWAKSRTPPIRVIAVEPQTAACLHTSLRVGANTTVETADTIMSGMCCGTVSPAAWEVLRDGVDCAVTVGDWECHEAVGEVRGLGVDAGPCGAGCWVGVRGVLGGEEGRRALGVDGGVWLLC